MTLANIHQYNENIYNATREVKLSPVLYRIKCMYRYSTARDGKKLVLEWNRSMDDLDATNRPQLEPGFGPPVLGEKPV